MSQAHQQGRKGDNDAVASLTDATNNSAKAIKRSNIAVTLSSIATIFAAATTGFLGYTTLELAKITRTVDQNSTRMQSNWLDFANKTAEQYATEAPRTVGVSASTGADIESLDPDTWRISSMKNLYYVTVEFENPGKETLTLTPVLTFSDGPVCSAAEEAIVGGLQSDQRDINIAQCFKNAGLAIGSSERDFRIDYNWRTSE